MNYINIPEVVKDKISFDRWRPIQRGEGMGKVLSNDDTFPFAFKWHFIAFNQCSVTNLGVSAGVSQLHVVASLHKALFNNNRPHAFADKNSGVNCAVFWRKRGKALHYLDTLAKDVTFLNLDWWFYAL